MRRDCGSVAHMFTRETQPGEVIGTFVEQALMRPFIAQRRLWDWWPAVSGDIATVGAPNTDSVESGDNAGAVFAADINWVTLDAESAKYSVERFLGGCRPSEEKWRRYQG